MRYIDKPYTKRLEHGPRHVRDILPGVTQLIDDYQKVVSLRCSMETEISDIPESDSGRAADEFAVIMLRLDEGRFNDALIEFTRSSQNVKVFVLGYLSELRNRHKKDDAVIELDAKDEQATGVQDEEISDTEEEVVYLPTVGDIMLLEDIELEIESIDADPYRIVFKSRGDCDPS